MNQLPKTQWRDQSVPSPCNIICESVPIDPRMALSPSTARIVCRTHGWDGPLVNDNSMCPLGVMEMRIEALERAVLDSAARIIKLEAQLKE